jgi:hypothetical protein
MPTIRNLSIFEIAYNIKVFLKLEAGVTRGDAGRGHP